MADGKGHGLMTRVVFKSLPKWEQKIWKSEKQNLEEIYCMYGDSYFGDKKEEAAPYMEMPNGNTPMVPWQYRFFKKTAPGKDFCICGYYKLARKVFEYYISKIVESLKMSKISDSAKFAGVLAHFIEDSGCPSHSIGVDLGIDMEIIKLLLPTKNKEKQLMQFHNILEGEYEKFSLKRYKPKLLGLNAKESSFNLLERFTDMLENSVKQILPMVEAFYKDDYKTLKKHLTEAGKFSSQVLADAFHTAFCIAYQKFEEKEKKELERVKVNRLTPYRWTGWAPYPYFYPVIRNSNMSLDKGFKPVPLRLNIDGKIKEFKEGFGLGAPFEITYLLPKGVYKKFHSYIALHSDLGKGGEIIFKVKINDRVVFNSGVIRDDKAREIEIKIENGEKFSLITQPTKNSFGKFGNQAIWAEPILIK
ncbi:MAG: NPCBM/NEW2 domain-containing protein [Candidatus Omnitrophica bacterium]|nr:NPCBM/NEW2 domain-containing protein [Candidatus Omnitrophota bacterium]